MHPRAVITWMGVLFCLSLAGMAEAAIVVTADYGTGSLGLGGLNKTYAGSADFDLSLSINVDWPPGGGSVTASSYYDSTGGFFETSASTAAERVAPRRAQAGAFWEFTVVDAATTFEMYTTTESGAYSVTLMDLGVNALVATDAAGGGYGGNDQRGTLLLGHTYRLTENTQTAGLTSDENARIDFTVGTSAVFNPRPEIRIQAPLDKATGLFSYTRLATPETTGFAYAYEWSTTLKDDWLEFTPAVDPPASDHGSPLELITVQVPAALLQNPTLFVRVKAQ